VCKRSYNRQQQQKVKKCVKTKGRTTFVLAGVMTKRQRTVQDSHQAMHVLNDLNCWSSLDDLFGGLIGVLLKVVLEENTQLGDFVFEVGGAGP